jgi:hypothetical protein
MAFLRLSVRGRRILSEAMLLRIKTAVKWRKSGCGCIRILFWSQKVYVVRIDSEQISYLSQTITKTDCKTVAKTDALMLKTAINLGVKLLK